MLGSEWQIGVDIQPDYLAVLGIQRLHHQWHVRFCWGKSIQLFNHNPVDFSASFSEIAKLLQEIRTLLPKRISVRVSFPPEQTLHRLIMLPANDLQPAVAERYIHLAAEQLFPTGLEEFAMDYCRKPHPQGAEVTLTLTRQQYIEQYLSILSSAGFDIDVLEIMPAALLPLLDQVMASTDKLLLLRTGRYWLWASQVSQRYQCDWALLAQDNEQLPETLRQPNNSAVMRLYCSSYTTPCPASFTRFSPFELFQRRGIRLPVNPGRYCLAAGLALRGEDRL